MQWILFVVALALVLVYDASAQCSNTTHPNCAQWVASGFCSNPFYSAARRQATCGYQCGQCPPATCTSNNNANCARWRAGAQNFCSSTTFTTRQKQIFCCSTCAAEIASASLTTSCAVLFDATTATVQLTNLAPSTTPYVFPVGRDLGVAFVLSGCSLALFTATDGTGSGITTLTGTSTRVSITDATQQGAGSAVCSCASG